MKAMFAWAWRREWIGWLLTLPIIWTLYGWASDRASPFVVVGAVVATPARPGEPTLMTGTVVRQLDRGCTARRHRSFLDAAGTRHDYGEAAEFSNDDLRNEARIMGISALRSSVRIPENAAPGVGMMLMTVSYRCNPVHYLVPIHYSVTVPVEVLP